MITKYKTHILKKDHRYYKLIPDYFSLFIWFRTKKITKYFNFSDGCDYNLNSDDQFDINKLFGVTFNIFPKIKDGKLLEPHHINSTRFGWRYLNNCIEIIPYEYKNEIRYMWTPIANLKINKWYKFEMIINKTTVEYNIYDVEANKKIGNYISQSTKTKLFGHYLGFYFGGNRTAPTDMYILEK